MKFNKSKSQIIFHTKFKKWEDIEEFEGIKVVNHTKVLGYIIDKKLNNKENIEYIKKKI